MRAALLAALLAAAALTGGCAAAPTGDDDPQSPMVKKMTSGASAIRAANLYNPGEMVSEPDQALKLSGEKEKRFAEVVYGGEPQAMSLSEMRRYRDLYRQHLKEVRETVERGEKVMRRLKAARMGGVYTADRPDDVVAMVDSWNDFLEAQESYTGPLVSFTALLGRASFAAQDSLSAAIDYREGKISRSAYERQVGRAGELILQTEDEYRAIDRRSEKRLMAAARRADRAFRASQMTGAINDLVQERFGANLALPGQDPG